MSTEISFDPTPKSVPMASKPMVSRTSLQRTIQRRRTPIQKGHLARRSRLIFAEVSLAPSAQPRFGTDRSPRCHMMHDVRSVDGVDRRHPVIQAQREILVEKIGRVQTIRKVLWTERDKRGGRRKGRRLECGWFRNRARIVRARCFMQSLKRSVCFVVVGEEQLHRCCGGATRCCWARACLRGERALFGRFPRLYTWACRRSGLLLAERAWCLNVKLV